MLFALPTHQLTPRRMPWVTWGLLALWIAAAAVLPEAAGERLGLHPQAPSAIGLAGHWLLHATWAHALTSVVLLLCVGSVLEEDWGHGFFAGFLAIAVLLTSAIYVGAASGSPRPLVGASGALAAAIAAYATRHLSDGVRYTYVGWWGGPVTREQWVPAWSIAGVWFAGEVLMQLAASGAGPTRGIHYAAQLSGAALGITVVLAMRHYDVERRWLGRAPPGADGPHPALEAARAARESVGAGAALELLEGAVRERPGDAALVSALCDVAREAGRPERARDALQTCLRALLQRGEAESAAGLWASGTRGIARPQILGRDAVRLGEALRRRGERTEAARVLSAALDAGRGVTPGLALRVVELTRDLHAGVALRALRRALEAEALDATKRQRLEALAAELEQRAALGDGPDLETPDVPDAPVAELPGDDRSIEIEPEEDLRAPPPELAAAGAPEAPRVASRVRGIAADGALVEEEGEDDPGELSDPDALLEPTAALPDTLPILAPSGAPSGAPAGQELAQRVLPPAPPSPPGADDPAPADAHQAVEGPRFAEAKRIEAVPVAWQEGRLQLRQGEEAPGWLDLRRIDAVAAGAVRGLGAKPVILVDLLLNWSELRGEPLRVIRLRSDRFDPARLLPGESRGLEAFRGWLAAMLAASGATPLPDSRSAHGRPFRIFESLEAYEREVLSIDV